jgi:Protein of unknown function (DUF1566)
MKVIKSLTAVAFLFASFFISSCSSIDEPVDPSVINIKIDVTTKIVSNIDSNTATCGGTVFSYDNITARGIVWSTTAQPTILNSKTIDAFSNGSYNSTLVGLLPNTLYYVRAYATNSTGTIYGNQQIFLTTAVSNLPSITTTDPSSVGNTIAISGGKITNAGSSPIIARGVVWSTSPTPTIADFKTTDGTGTGTFVSTLTALLPTTLYYIRAYATNSSITAYGNEKTFTTTNVVVTLPTLTTTAASSITLTTATAAGTITSDGGAPITERGVCWATTTLPTIINTRTINGTGIGIFTSDLTALTQATTYYVRAYATNTAGTAYGAEITCTTLAPPPFVIGQSHQGGTIFYLDSSGIHGLIVADVDQTTSPWGCATVAIAGTLPDLGTGNANTNLITTACSDITAAARICSNLTLNTQTDWYLPSKTELNTLFLNKTASMNLTSGSYWSSTQSDVPAASNEAFYQNFGNGTVSTFIKSANYRVRAIRSF